jgi:hypothetical protein
MLYGGATNWTSKLHDVIMAMSTTEVGYIALIRAAQSAVHFRQLLQDVHHHQRGRTTKYEDNEGVVEIANNPMASHMANDIDIRQHYTIKLVDARTIPVISIPTSDIPADGLSKALPQPMQALSESGTASCMS